MVTEEPSHRTNSVVDSVFLFMPNKLKVRPRTIHRIAYQKPAQPVTPLSTQAKTYKPSINITKKGLVIGQSQSDISFFKSLRLQLDSNSVTEPYRQHIWVYSCISTIAMNIAGVPFNIYTGTEANPKLVEEGTRDGKEGGLVYLFNHPNPQMSRYQLWEALMVYLGLDGECICLLNKPKGKEMDFTAIPTEIWPMRATNFEPIIDNNYFIGWNYKVGGKVYQLHPAQVIQFKYFNPYNQYRGLSPISACEMGIKQDWMASKYNLAFFENSGDPGGLLLYKGEGNSENLTPDEKKEILAKWNDRHMTPANAHRVALLEGNWDYKQIQIDHKTMQFLEQLGWNRDQICAAFKLSKEDIGIISEMNLANSLIRDKVLWTKNLVPKMNYITDVLWTRLFSKIGNGSQWGSFDYTKIEALQEELKSKIESGFKLFQMGYPPNFVNKKLNLGMPDLTWGNEIFLPFSMVTASSLLTKPAEEPEPAPEKEPAKELPSPNNTIVAKIQGDELDALLFSLGEWNKKLKELTKPLYETIMTMAGQQIGEELGGLFAFNLADPKMVEFLKTKLIKVTDTNDTIRNQLKESLQEGISLNETANELQERIKTTFNYASNRSLTIARTETAETSSGVRFIAMQEEGVEEQEWVSARDDHVRKPPDSKYNHAIDGEHVKIGEKFSNGLRYASDNEGDAGNVINCRCLNVVYKEGKALANRELFWKTFVERILDPNEKIFHAKIKAYIWKLRVAQLKLFAKISE